TIIKNVEKFLIFARPKQVRAKPRSSPQHLPELCFRAHELEEDQIDNFRDVDTGVQHVHRNGDMRLFGWNRKIVYQVLNVVSLEVDDPRKLSFVVRIIDIKTLSDELRMVVILGEDYGLSQAIPTGDRKTTGHQVLQHLVHGILIEEPPVYSFGLHASWYRTVVVPVERIPLVFFFFGQLVV